MNKATFACLPVINNVWRQSRATCKHTPVPSNMSLVSREIDLDPVDFSPFFACTMYEAIFALIGSRAPPHYRVQFQPKLVNPTTDTDQFVAWLNNSAEPDRWKIVQFTDIGCSGLLIFRKIEQQCCYCLRNDRKNQGNIATLQSCVRVGNSWKVPHDSNALRSCCSSSSSSANGNHKLSLVGLQSWRWPVAVPLG